jgi:hypothetical protein
VIEELVWMGRLVDVFDLVKLLQENLRRLVIPETVNPI